jgi:hypothetical protein
MPSCHCQTSRQQAAAVYRRSWWLMVCCKTGEEGGGHCSVLWGLAHGPSCGPSVLFIKQYRGNTSAFLPFNMLLLMRPPHRSACCSMPATALSDASAAAAAASVLFAILCCMVVCRWDLQLCRLPRQHWGCVALGPPEAAVDAWGVSRAS